MDKLKILNKRKKPSDYNKNNYVGIEFEFWVDRQNRSRGIITRQLKSNLIKQGLFSNAHLGNDGSIRPDTPNIEGIIYSHKYELRVMTKEQDLESTLIKVQNFLSSINAKHNNSCGLHVHLDMRNRNKSSSYRRLLGMEGVLKHLVAEHRRENSYCSFSSNINSYWSSLSKYRAINNLPINTIEIRCKEMLLDMDRVYNWVMFLIGIVDNKYVDSRDQYVQMETALLA